MHVSFKTVSGNVFNEITYFFYREILPFNTANVNSDFIVRTFSSSFDLMMSIAETFFEFKR